MIATIELPNNTHERDFVLEVLKRLNIRFTLDNMSEDVEESVLEEHAAILRDRRKAMQAPDAQFYTWEQAQTVLANRKANKSI
jgi:Fungal ubiquitin-associated domain